MSLVKNKNNSVDEIIDYLIKHPDFFNNHPDVLSCLEVPHELDGKVSSLIEYQVRNLKKEISILKTSINKYSEEKENNRQLAKHIHALSLQLVTADNIACSVTMLKKQLQHLLLADKVLLFIFCDNQIKSECPELIFQEKDSKSKLMFTEVFHRGKPLCGSLQEEHIRLLFGKQVDTVHSTILIPMSGKSWQALLVIGSNDHNCYSHGFQLDSLVYLAQIISLVIDKHL